MKLLFDQALEDEAETFRRALETEDHASFKRLFIDAAIPPPTFTWVPKSEDLSSPELKFLLSYWLGLRRDDLAPRQNRIDAADMWAALGFIMLLDVIDGGRDFRYRLYGSKIADRSKIDMTGKLLSEFAIERVTRAFFFGCYRAVMARPDPLVTTHTHAPGINIASTTRLILPLANDEGAISRFLVGNIPGAWRSGD